MAQRAPFDVPAILRPVRRRLWLTCIAENILRGLAIGAGLGVVWLLINHVARVPHAFLGAGLATLLGAVGGLIWGLTRRPNSLQAARVVDRHFGLHDRVTTALELRDQDGWLAALQRREAQRRVAALDIVESARGRVQGREMGIPAIALVVLLALTLWAVPNSTTARTAHAQGDSQRIQKVAKRNVPAISKKLEKSLTTAQRNNPNLRKLEATLAKLRSQLLHTQNRAAALKAISTAQQHLQNLSQSLHPINSRAVAQLNSAMSHYLNAQQRAAAQTGNQQATAISSQVLQRLSKQLAHMTPAQRSRLAQALAKAANRTSGSQLRAALHQAASSLAYQDPQTASSELQKASQALQNSPANQTAQQRAQQASNELDSLKNEVSGLSPNGQPTPGQAGQQASGQNGQQPGSQNGRQTSGQNGKQGSGKSGGPGKGKGQTSGLGPGKGKGQSQQGQGSGAGKGLGKGSQSGTGQGKGQGSGQNIISALGGPKGAGQGQRGGLGQGQTSGTSGHGTPGGHGPGGGRGGSGPRGQGRFATVYSPGKEGKGPHSTQTGPLGQPQTGPYVPYTQVVQRYVNAAHAALDRSPLPPSEQQYVQKYFTAISR